MAEMTDQEILRELEVLGDSVVKRMEKLKRIEEFHSKYRIDLGFLALIFIGFWIIWSLPNSLSEIKIGIVILCFILLVVCIRWSQQGELKDSIDSDRRKMVALMEKGGHIEIISAYGAAMANRSFGVGLESALPYPKELIREVLTQELINPSNSALEIMDSIQEGFWELESFLPDEEYQKVTKSYQAVLDGEIETMDKEVAVRTLEDSSEITVRITARKAVRMGQARKMREISADKVEAYRVTRDRVDALLKEMVQRVSADDAQEQNPNNDHRTHT